MKKQIRLLKEWTNDGITYPLGRLLNLNEEDAKSLVGAGICEMYEPRANDVVTVDNDVKQTSPYELSKEDKKEICNTILKYKSELELKHKQDDSFTQNGGYDTMGEFAIDVRKSLTGRGATDKMKSWLEKAADGQSEGIDSDGGYLVPTVHQNTLMMNLLETSTMYPKTMKIPMGTNSVDIPTVIDASHATSVFGGVIVYRPDEGGTITSSKIKFGKVNLKLSKLAALCFVTTELLEDSPESIEPLLNTAFGSAIGFQIDEDLMNGTGAGHALGVLNAPSLISVAKEGSQTNLTIETANILNMWSRLMPRSQGNAEWWANIDTFVQLATLNLEVGTSGGSAAGLLQMSTNGVTGAPLMTLLGRPIHFTEHSQKLGDKGDIVLADMGQYLVGEKNGGSIRAASSIHLKFDTDQTAFRFIVRMDGQPWEQTALTPKHSSATLSSFVTLAERKA